MKFSMTDTAGDTFTADLDGAHGVRVPMGDVDGWECRWVRPFCRANNDHALGIHFWLLGGQPVKAILSNGAWAPGLPYPGAVATKEVVWNNEEWELGGGGAFPLRFHVSIALDGNVTPYEDALGGPIVKSGLFEVISNPYDAGEQGGQGVWLLPGPRCSEWRADCIAERNPIAAFHASTGEPLTRRELGVHRYELLRCHVGVYIEGQQHPQFRGGNPFDGDSTADTADWNEVATWTAIDGPHLIRAFADDLHVFRTTRSPIARWRLIMLGYDVMNAFPVATMPNGVQSLGTMLANVKRSPGLAKIGVVRQLAWSARAVCAAREAYGKPHREMDLWLKMFVEMLWLAQAPSGVIGDFEKSEGLYQGEPWTVGTALDSEGVVAAWEMNFVPRALYHASQLLNDPVTTERVQQYVAKYLSMFVTAPEMPDEYVYGVTGLSRYLVTSGSVTRTYGGLDKAIPMFPVHYSAREQAPTVTKGAWSSSRSEGEPDVFAVAVRLGLRAKLPAKYNRPGELEFVSDAQAVASEFGVEE